jgi:hypothetical protein
MPQTYRRLLVLLALVLTLPGVSRAADLTFHTLTALVGVGSSLDVDATDLEHKVLQAGYSFETGDNTRVGVRVGRYSFAKDMTLNGFRDPRLTYGTAAGELRFDEAVYDSGIYIGLGVYRMEGAVGDHEVEIGFTLGYNGEFEVSRHFSVALELAGHFADFPQHQSFAQLMGGLAWHF